MPILNKPDMNYGIWAEGGNIEIPSSEKVEEGWVVEKPLNETMNWLQNRQDRMLQYINERGIPEWDSRTQYPLDAFVARSGVIYKAISPNTDNDPTLHTTIWNIAFVSYSDFIDYAEKIDSIENDEGYLGLYVSKANPVMDAPSKGIAYNNKTSDTGYGFNEDTPVINNQGVSVAEFSGGNNPKDVVTHEQLALAIQNYKVGDIYITTADGDPSARLGYGSWERFGKGRTLVGFSDEVSNTVPEWVKSNGSESGKYQDNIKTNELPNHKHTFVNSYDGNSYNSRAQDIHNWSKDIVEGSVIQKDLSYAPDDTYDSGFLQYTKDMPHTQTPLSVVQPSIVVYFWKRTA